MTSHIIVSDIKEYLDTLKLLTDNLLFSYFKQMIVYMLSFYFLKTLFRTCNHTLNEKVLLMETEILAPNTDNINEENANNAETEEIKVVKEGNKNVKCVSESSFYETFIINSFNLFFEILRLFDKLEKLSLFKIPVSKIEKLEKLSSEVDFIKLLEGKIIDEQILLKLKEVLEEDSKRDDKIRSILSKLKEIVEENRMESDIGSVLFKLKKILEGNIRRKS
jgi:hypothetical protein